MASSIILMKSNGYLLLFNNSTNIRSIDLESIRSSAETRLLEEVGFLNITRILELILMGGRNENTNN
jgi:hypothetical protein